MFNEGIRGHEGYDAVRSTYEFRPRVHSCKIRASILRSPRSTKFPSSLSRIPRGVCVRLAYPLPFVLVFQLKYDAAFANYALVATSHAEGTVDIGKPEEIFNAVCPSAVLDDENDQVDPAIIRYAIGKSSSNLRQAYLPR